MSAGKLTIKGIEKAIKEAKAAGIAKKAADGGGLYLEITKAGGTYWRMKYRFTGKEKRLSFGVYPDVSLVEAREKRREAKKHLELMQDPSEIRKLAKRQLAAEYENSFETIAREWHKQREHAWQPKHAENIMKRLEAHIFSTIGFRPITYIKAPEVLEAVRKLEAKGSHDLAHRLMQTCSHVFRYAIATGRAETDPTVNLKGALKPVKTKSYSYLKEADLPDFFRKIEAYDTEFRGNLLTKLAFKLLILTFVRSGEIRDAKWEEINWEKAQWHIPAERMKMKEKQIVPLSRQSLEILKEVRKITGNSYSGYIFPSHSNPRKVMSENTFLRVIDVIGYKGKTTAHGFRSV